MGDKYEEELLRLKAIYHLSKDERDYGGMVKNGQVYYEFLRNGPMTQDDKEALQNDILLAISAG